MIQANVWWSFNATFYTETLYMKYGDIKTVKYALAMTWKLHQMYIHHTFMTGDAVTCTLSSKLGEIWCKLYNAIKPYMWTASNISLK